MSNKSFRLCLVVLAIAITLFTCSFFKVFLATGSQFELSKVITGLVFLLCLLFTWDRGYFEDLYAVRYKEYLYAKAIAREELDKFFQKCYSNENFDKFSSCVVKMHSINNRLLEARFKPTVSNIVFKQYLLEK